MAGKDHTPEQAIGMLREAEVRLSQDEKIGNICRVLADVVDEEDGRPN